MAKYHFTNKAVEDLANIWNYTFETWSERQADTYYNMLIESCQKIVENPWLYGVKYDEITEGLRGYRANKHIIGLGYSNFYRLHFPSISFFLILPSSRSRQRPS